MKGRSKKADGGAQSGTRDWEKDLADKPERRNNANKIFGEAEEKKRGGRAGRKHGGMIHGEGAKHHAGRKARKSGGRTGSNMNPLSSAHAGTPPSGHKTTEID